jgi:hypothetical protein
MCPREVRTEIMGKRRQKKTLLLEMMDRTLRDGDVLWARGIAVVEGTIASLDLESRLLGSYNQSYLTTGVLHFGLLCRRERRGYGAAFDAAQVKTRAFRGSDAKGGGGDVISLFINSNTAFLVRYRGRGS